MKSSWTAGLTGLCFLSLLVTVPSCTRDTAQSDNAAQQATQDEAATTTNTDVTSEVDTRPLGLTAHLVDESAHAAGHAAVVEVEVTGIRLEDPALGSALPPTESSETEGMSTEGGTAAEKIGHLHYRLDGGPVIATPVTRLSFHELAPGQHTITVMLASPDHAPLGPQQTLTFEVPA